MIMKNLKCSMIFLGISCLALTACSGSGLKTVKPYRGKIQASFTEKAKTKLENIYYVNMPIDGILQRINLIPGTPVKKGQIVAQLNQLPLVEAVKKAGSKLSAMQAYYDNQKLKWQRRKELSQHGFVSKSVMDEIQSLKKVYFAKYAEAEADQAVIKYNLNVSTMRSPVNGLVLSRETQGGRWMETGSPIMQIGSMKDIEVVSDVLTQDAQQIHVGSPVLLSSIGSPEVLRGKVKRIDPAGFTKKSSLGVDEQRVHVITTIKDYQKANLGVGYRLQAKFLIGKEDADATIVPRFSVLQDDEGNFYVFKVVDKKLKKQIVKTGIATDRRIAITKGLTTKDIIVAQPTADMHDGMKI